MSKITFIDTLYVIALINQRDQYHSRAEELAREYDGGRFLTTDAVLTEIGNGLARAFKEQAVQVIEYLLTSDDIEVVRVTPDLFASAFGLYCSHRDKEWGMTDCISFVVMRQAGVEEALDRHFVQAGFQALLRDEP